MNWLDGLNQLDRSREASVLITILQVEGSAPRTVGTKMVVTASQQFDSIGGGNLEYQAIAQARQILQQRAETVTQSVISLGPDRSQCCGGRVTLLFELRDSRPIDIALFGAGHVGTALVKILSELDCHVSWFDSRSEQFSETHHSVRINKELIVNNHQSVEHCRSGMIYLVMTHSHDDDFELVEAILSRGDARFCGLIASASKAKSFKKRLKRKQFTDSEIGLLTAPVGIDLGDTKEPMAVAVSIAAQLIGQFGSVAALELDHRKKDAAVSEG